MREPQQKPPDDLPAEIKAVQKIVAETGGMSSDEKYTHWSAGHPVAFKPADTLKHHAPGHTDLCTCAECLEASEHICHCYGCEPKWRQKPKTKLMEGSGYFTAARAEAEGLAVTVFRYDEDRANYVQVHDAADVDVDAGVAHRISQPEHTCRSPKHRSKAGACLYEDRGEYATHVRQN